MSRRNTTRSAYLSLTVGITLANFSPTVAAPIYQPPGANLTFGDVTHGQRVLSAAGNPAAAAADLGRADEAATRGTVVSAVVGIEYGNIQDLWETLDEISKAFAPSRPPDDDDDPVNLPEPPGGGISIGDILDALFPNLGEVIDAAVNEFETRLKLLALLEFEAYAKGFASIDVPFIVGREFFDGAWTFGVNESLESKLYGVTRPIDFDPQAALMDLQSQYDLSPDDVATVYDVVGDVDFIFDPSIGDIRMRLDSDNVLITKASKTTEISAGYSREAFANDHGRLYLGAEVKYYALDLARVGVRFGDITDSEELFESIRDSKFERDSTFGIDLGVLWVGQNYQFGASLTNVNQPGFDYPVIDTSFYRDGTIIEFLETDRTYEMERQLKLEASWFSPARRWTANIGVDANSIVDPVGDKFQWTTVSGGYQPDNRWLQSFRVGYRRNMVGTEKTYLSAGVTAFRFFNLDIATSRESVNIDGTQLPEGAIISLGFQFTF
jgi:hypothetical protein